MISDRPTIKTLIVDNLCYVYDTYSNYIFGVNNDTFYEIRELQKVGIKGYELLNKKTQAYDDVISLLNKNILKVSFIKEIKHFNTDNVPEMIDRCINHLILGVTNKCNFKCRYCHQAEGKVLSSKTMMEKDTAFQSVDYLFTHSKDAFEVTITFYGGEPLLNFELIRTTVDYAQIKFKTKNINFNMTTNASLLNEEAVDFLVKNKFDLLISLDGDDKTQNSHRRFLTDGEDTFSSVWKNVMYIKDNHPDYFKSNVRFNSVFLNDEDPENILRFFRENGISEAAVTTRRADMSGIDYYVSPISLYNIPEDNAVDNSIFKDYVERYSDKNLIPRIWHHNGPCIPAVRRLFVNADGELYPCEKVDSDCSSKLGTLEEGLDSRKVCELLNIGKLTEQECKKCWAARFCTICIHDCIDSGTISKAKKMKKCEQQKKNAVLFLRKYIKQWRHMK